MESVMRGKLEMELELEASKKQGHGVKMRRRELSDLETPPVSLR